MVTVKQLAQWIEETAPKSLAESWDNVGLQVGNPAKEVRTVLTCLTVTPDVVSRAESFGADCIVSHHPLLFSPLRQLDFQTAMGRLVQRLCAGDIAVYSAHTNYDKAPAGLNQRLAEALGLTNIVPLKKEGGQVLHKLVVFVPLSHLDAVRNAVGDAGAGHIGAYSHCSFSVLGEGTFLPGEHTNPYIGRRCELTRVQECRLETIVPHDKLEEAIEAMLASHPYEEVAYDVYPLTRELPSMAGLGRVGSIDNGSWAQFFENTQRILGEDVVRIIKSGKLKESAGARRVAVCGGSGGSLIRAAAACADLYITGDIDYHDALLAQELGLEIWDFGHYGTEILAAQWLADIIRRKAESVGTDIRLVVDVDEKGPFSHLVR